MKTVLLLRHAKSSWKAPARADHDRPLNARGKRDAPRMGRWLLERDLVPDVVLCSTALRARATWKLMARELGDAAPEDVRLEDDLYPTDAHWTLHLVNALPDTRRRVMVIGHNPGLEDLLEAATGVFETMPTAAIAQLDFDVDAWREVTWAGQAKLAGPWRPKELPVEP